jgi:hypothetical protein
MVSWCSWILQRTKQLLLTIVLTHLIRFATVGNLYRGDKIVSNALQSVPVVEYSPVLNVLLPEDQQTGNLTRTDPSSVQPGGVAYNSVEIADATSAKPVKPASVQVGVGATESASHDQNTTC